MISIEYSNTINDLVAAQKVALRHSSTSQNLMVQRWLLVEALLAGLCVMFAFNHSPRNVLMAFLALSALAWVLRYRTVVVQFRRDLKREVKKDTTRSLFQPRILRLTETGISIDTSGTVADYDWSKVVHVGTDKRYLYVITDGVLHYAVPRRAAADDTQWEQFVAAVQSGFDQAKSASTAQ